MNVIYKTLKIVKIRRGIQGDTYKTNLLEEVAQDLEVLVERKVKEVKDILVQYLIDRNRKNPISVDRQQKMILIRTQIVKM